MGNLHSPRAFFMIVTVLLMGLVLPGCHKAPPPGPAFNVPSLLGLKVDAVQNTLSLAPVETPVWLQPALDKKYRTFKKDGWYLVVTYVAETGKVLDFTIGTEENDGKLKEKERFLKAGTLREEDPLYRTDYLEAPDTVFSFIGVHIVPQPISHKVTFRISGTQDLLSVIYNVRPPAGTPTVSRFVTVPPWEESLTAITGTQLTLDATPAPDAPSRSSEGPIQATVQILIDGKVAQESKLAGLWAKCAMEIEY